MFLLCAHCGDRIGVYERTVVIEGSGARTTSMAREPLLSASRASVLHADCADALGITTVSGS